MSHLISNTPDNLVDIILNTVDDPMFVTDTHGRIVRVNRAFEDCFGWRAEEAMGKDASLLKSNRHDKAFFDNLWRCLKQDGFWQGTIYNQTKLGKVVLAQCKMRAQFDDDGSVLYYVSRMKVEEEEGAELVKRNIDPLTGLPDRYLFADRLEQAMIAAKRIHKSVVLLYMGIDHFSTVNDGLGYHKGDEILQEVSGRLQTCMRGSDTVARLGGDLFAMALQVSAIDDGVVIAEKVLKSIQKTFHIDHQDINITASIGLSICPVDSSDPQNLLKLADSAMHHAKKSGGNNYKFFAPDMNVKAKARIEMENAIRKGLQKDEFLLYYQPKVAAGTEEIVGAEALIRWQSPEKGFMPPGDFIPVAEESGLISDIGNWVLNEAVRQNKAWQSEGLKPIRIAVNVAAPQFRSMNFLNDLKHVLETHDLKAEWLELEIVESMLMGDADSLIEKLKMVRDIGCKLSIDDFGTGYSSLSYLTRFPITTLKIDRAFIHDLENDPTMAEIARAIIGMSQGLQLEVVAEGAENLAHVDFLRQNGCQMVQGFYYSKPVPALEFGKLLKIGTIHRRSA